VDIYLYVEADTPLHRLDPRAKMLMLLALLLMAVAVDHPVLPGGLFLLVLVLAHVGRAWRSLRRVRTLLFIIGVFSTVTWSLFARGETPLFGPVQVEALLYGIGTGFKLVSTIAGSVVFLATTKNEEIATGLIRIGVPYPVAFAFSTALRLVPTFVGAGVTIIQAQKSRGLDVESGGFFQRLRKHLPLMVPVFAAAIRSTNQLAMALEAKGFGARPVRTYYLHLEFRPADWITAATGAALVVTALYLRLFSDALRIPGLIR